MEAPLAIMPPPTKKVAPSTGSKRKATTSDTRRKRTLVKPTGELRRASSSLEAARAGKAPMPKTSAPKPAPSKTTETSGAPLRIERFSKLPPIKRPAGHYESSDDEEEAISTLIAEKKELQELYWDLNEKLEAILLEIKNRSDEIESLKFQLEQKGTKLAKKAGVSYAL